MCALDGSGELESGEDKHLISSSCEGIVIVKVGVNLFEDKSVSLSSILFMECIV